jgi:hypothetical protein
LKTGIYYLRSQAKTAAQKFSVDLEKVGSGGSIASSNSVSGNKEVKKEEPVKEKEEPECIMCSS